RYRPGTVAL
nr:Chain C, ARG-TYR-ARG-PRO-GLY-THR-VAL-ALA-LEU [Homo sapiens]6PA1_C Chain C, ARG-TYR-ARG-PRO-GLY-THR-VAL-ALA-LEU [synthetic construct]6PA1_G Chain G, ARG-TYR-ARG-PRO-GLY-THR-VAL-ALA-LEU [synthetic construct]6PAG_C Chain C, ARG-TYR-ARG-PRO-GLY-THR-VAL-ALA-LEU [synthetic construct]